MSPLELVILSVSLAMDAFAVSVCKGMAAGKPKPYHALLCGGYFGAFQMLMPLIGYYLASAFHDAIERFDHWIAFGLLALIGINMIRESFNEEKEASASFSFGTMTALAVATSIDAMAAGVSLSILSVRILPSVLCIGAITFVIAFAGVYIGRAAGTRFSGNAERLGGLVLILLGIKILLTDLLG